MKRQTLEAGALARDKPFGVLSHAVPGFVWVADGRGRIRHVSGRWSAFTGLSSERSMKWGWLDAVHPEDVERIKRLWSPRILDSMNAVEVELRCRRHDGLYRWHLLRALPSNENADEWVACTIDIHDRVAAQLAQEGQVHILEMIALGMPLDDILCALCHLAEDILPDANCSVVPPRRVEGRHAGHAL
jgi:PAS domain S-box-containing protein